MEAKISDNKVYMKNPNRLEQYVQDCINDAVDRLKNHNIVEPDPLGYIIKLIVGYDEAYDPEWQPVARFAKHNLADTETALKFIAEYYVDFRETVNDMAEDMGKDTFYECIFKETFDLVRLTVTVYTEITYKFGIATEILD